LNATSENDAFNSNYENSSINLVAKPLLIMKKTTINLPTVIPISVNTATTTQAKKVNTDSYTDVKIGEFRVSVKYMRDLKNGGCLDDNVRIKKKLIIYEFKKYFIH
jgi:hypothetical protein